MGLFSGRSPGRIATEVECDVQWTFREDVAKLGRVLRGSASVGSYGVAVFGPAFRAAHDLGHGVRGLNRFPHGTSSIARHPVPRQIRLAAAVAAARILLRECQ